LRILIFHGYLLGGTGSNVYNARLAEALVGQGHEVHLICQDPRPDEHDFVDAVGDWGAGTLRIRELARPREQGTGRCIVYKPDIGGLLPVYVADRYEGIEARPFSQCSEAEVQRYIEANVDAVAAVASAARPQAALANHLIMGPVILARALKGEVPYAVKIHGSALEYTVKPEPERFLPFACEGLAGAGGILVGSHHTAASLWEALDDPELPERTRLGPPGVDVRRFAPRAPEAAVAGVHALAARLGAAQEPKGDIETSAFTRDERAAARAIERLDPGSDRLVVFVGKLIVSKGVDLLVAAWPLVIEDEPLAKLVVVGFGAYRQALEDLLGALGRGDLESARALVLAGRSLEESSVPPHPLRHLLAFLDSLEGEQRERYLRAAADLSERVVLTGRLEHDELADLLPACEALVVPSTFPEAFGMVAAEAAACGVLPLSAAHSGLAEVSEALALAVPEPVAQFLSFPIDDESVWALAQRLTGWLGIAPELRAETRTGLVDTVRERWSWDRVARGVIAAAHGELDGLGRP
jgi:glycosyltransferase involved in cell wall biosynthesis